MHFPERSDMKFQGDSEFPLGSFLISSLIVELDKAEPFVSWGSQITCIFDGIQVMSAC
jgi:hypothetical protein